MLKKKAKGVENLQFSISLAFSFAQFSAQVVPPAFRIFGWQGVNFLLTFYGIESLIFEKILGSPNFIKPAVD